MGIRFAKRAAAEILGRGVSAIRIRHESASDAAKALTREDIRRMIKDGSIFAIKAKHNLSENSKFLKKARAEGRSRGTGRRRGTSKARSRRLWAKKVRSQRRLLKELKKMKKVDNAIFTAFYRQIKGGQYATKANLVLQLRERGVGITDDELKAINDKISAEYKGSK